MKILSHTYWKNIFVTQIKIDAINVAITFITFAHAFNDDDGGDDGDCGDSSDNNDIAMIIIMIITMIIMSLMINSLSCKIYLLLNHSSCCICNIACIWIRYNNGVQIREATIYWFMHYANTIPSLQYMEIILPLWPLVALYMPMACTE